MLHGLPPGLPWDYVFYAITNTVLHSLTSTQLHGGQCTPEPPLVLDMSIYYGYNYKSTSTNNNRDLPKQIYDRVGVIKRNDIGLLLWEKDMSRTAKWQLGSRLKTPTLPMWVTKVNGHYGVLFNPNRELMRSYHAENR